MSTPFDPFPPGIPLPKRTLMMRVAYDGGDFVGWQVQENRRSVQGCLMEAFEKMVGAPTQIRGAGRTDAGVHAQGQLAAADVEVDIPCEGFLRGLNRHLPPDIVIVSVQDATPGFNPRRAARGKIYRYTVFNHAIRSPLHRRDTWWVRAPLNTQMLRECAALLVGEHDFAGFRAADCQRHTTRRTIRRIDVSRQGPTIHIEVEGTAFLKNMVRIMAGTMVDVARGAMSLDEVRNVLRTGDRKQAGVTAPPQGLTLVEAIL